MNWTLTLREFIRKENLLIYEKYSIREKIKMMKPQQQRYLTLGFGLLVIFMGITQILQAVGHIESAIEAAVQVADNLRKALDSIGLGILLLSAGATILGISISPFKR